MSSSVSAKTHTETFDLAFSVKWKFGFCVQQNEKKKKKAHAHQCPNCFQTSTLRLNNWRYFVLEKFFF